MDAADAVGAAVAAKLFSRDVFLSHSSKDKGIVRDLATRLRADGLRVWFDEWEIKPGDSIPALVEEGLAASRILVLCMSAGAFGSDWARLESQTFQFRDPLNRERRFIPLRLDDADPKGSLAQFLYIDWRKRGAGRDGDGAYAKLLEACRPPTSVRALAAGPVSDETEVSIRSCGHTRPVLSFSFGRDGQIALSASADRTMRLRDLESGNVLRVFEGHTAGVCSVQLSLDGRVALSGSRDGTVRLWDVESGRGLGRFDGHSAGVNGAQLSADGRRALSASEDTTVRLWDVESGSTLRIFAGHVASVRCVVFSPDGRRALSASEDRSVRLWDLESGRLLGMFEGHRAAVHSVTFSPDGRLALSASEDATVRLWDLESGRAWRVFEGHTSAVSSGAFSPDGRFALSGSDDKTMRLWEVNSGRLLRVFEGHASTLCAVAFSLDGRRALSGSVDDSVRLWDVGSGQALRAFEGHVEGMLGAAFSPDGRFALSASLNDTIRLWDVDSGAERRVFKGHTESVYGVAFSLDGRLALSASADKTVRVWGVREEGALRVLEGHVDLVLSVAFNSDAELAISASADRTVRLWEVRSGRALRTFEGHLDIVGDAVFSPDGRLAASASADRTVRLWEVASGRVLHVLEGHAGVVCGVAFSPDGQSVLSASADNTARLWDVRSGRALRILDGHTNWVRRVAFSADGRLALSASDDKTARLWDIHSGKTLRVLEGHSDALQSVAFSADGRRALSAAANGVLRIWSLKPWAARPPSAGIGSDPAPEQLQYTNAKVLLVGDSGAGKTGLRMRLTEDTWRASDSTVGAWATQWKIDVPVSGDVEREIWLWDFGGQWDQRLLHHLFMDESRLSVLVFDPQRDDLLEGLAQWDRELTRSSSAKLLVAGRIDAGGLRVPRKQVDRFVSERGFAAYLETSARSGTGCEALKRAIVEQIRWDELPWRSSPRQFKRLKDEIIHFKDEGRVLMRFKDLRDALALRIPGEGFRDEELEAVLTLLAGPGVVWKLSFGSWLLLQPERVNAYAQAVIQTLRADRHEMGSISEEKVLRGDLVYQSSLPRLPAEDERIVLLAMHQILVERGFCLRQHTEMGTQLVFPTYYRRERPDVVGHPIVAISYRFDGFIDEIYATLVVRLHHAEPLKHSHLWRYAADFETLTGKRLGVKLNRRAEGSGELEIYFDPAVSMEEQIIFSKYVHEHLVKHAKNVMRLRHYVCKKCKTPVGNREIAMARLASGKKDIICVNCEKRVPLRDELEERFAAPQMQREVHERAERVGRVLDDESRKRSLVGEVISTAALAGQISRELAVSDYGIDMEIEFKSDAGAATGSTLYLQLRLGDTSSTRDQREVFTIHDERHVRYWIQHGSPVMLVVRSPDGEVRWMEVAESLRRESEGRTTPVREIIFEGERFDVMSVRRWRERVLPPPGGSR